MKKVIFIGAGGHAKSVFDSIDSSVFKLVGFLDDKKTGTFLGLPIFGRAISSLNDFKSFCYFVTIGDVKSRMAWYETLDNEGLEIINVIDSTANISKTAKMGKGNFIGKEAIINADVVIGNDNIINTRALIEHESTIADHCHISTNSVLNGNTTVADLVFFGSCAVSIGQLRIGMSSVVGAGSVVTKDVEPFTTVVGVPAKVIKRRSPDA